MEIAKCPIRYEFYSEAHRPMILECGHTMCETCVIIMFKGGELKCPQCQRLYYNLSSMKVNYALLNCEYEKCSEHGEPAEFCCIHHALLLCGRCAHSATTCDRCDYQSDSYELHHKLVSRIEALCDGIEVEKLPPTLRAPYESRLRLKFAALCEVIRNFKRFRFPCSCSQTAAYIERSELAFYCEQCAATSRAKVDSVAAQPSKYISLDDEKAAMQQLAEAGWELLGMCHFHYITIDLYARLYNPGSLLNLLKCVQDLKALVGLRELRVSEFPEIVVCPSCKNELRREGLNMMRLPCRGVFHAHCGVCCSGKLMIQCCLDARTYSAEGLALIQPQPQPMPRSQVRQQPSVSNSPFSVCGLPVPAFNRRVPGEQCVSLFTRMLPVANFPSEFNQFRESNNGYPVKFGLSKKPVEALTFKCFKNVILVGVGLGNPVVPGVSLNVEFVKFYAGNSAKGSAVEMVTSVPAQITLGSTVTDLYFSKPLRILANKSFTLKLKFSEPRDRQPVALYAGNHMSRPTNPSGTDELAWEFNRTEDLDSGELCSNQLYIFGPIIRLIYRP